MHSKILANLKHPLLQKIAHIHNIYSIWSLIRKENEKKSMERNILLDTIYFNLEDWWIFETIKLFDSHNENTEYKTIWIIELKQNIEKMTIEERVWKTWNDWEKELSKYILLYESIEQQIHENDPVIKRLKEIRNKRYCHNDYKIWLKQRKFDEVSLNEAYNLLVLAKKIWEETYKEDLIFEQIEEDNIKNFKKVFNLKDISN